MFRRLMSAKLPKVKWPEATWTNTKTKYDKLELLDIYAVNVYTSKWSLFNPFNIQKKIRLRELSKERKKILGSNLLDEMKKY